MRGNSEPVSKGGRSAGGRPCFQKVTAYLRDGGTVLQFMRTTMTKRTIANSPRTIAMIAAKRETSPNGRPHRRCGPENLGVPGAFISV